MIAKIIRFVRTNYALIIILIIAAALRFYGLRWDSGFPTNPDEGNIVLAAHRIKFFANLDPKFFVYGGLPIYLISAVSQFLAAGENLYRIHLVSRVLAALASTGSLFFIYLTARKLFGRLAAVVALVFAAFAPGLIQYAHFGVSESLIILSLLGVLYFSLLFLDKPTVKKALVIGLFAGAGIASKFQAFSFLLIPLLSICLVLYRRRGKSLFVKSLLAILGPAIVIFLIFNPYLFIDRSLFLKEFIYETSVAQGNQVVHYTLQFIGADAFAFNIKNIFWLVGPVSLFGFLFLSWFVFSKMRKDNKFLIFVLFPIIYFLYVNSWHTKFIRYMLPIIPFALIAAAGVLTELRKRNRVIGTIFLVLALVITVGYGTAFFNLYRAPMTTVMASEWIFANVPRGAKILTEALDLKLPLALPGQDPGKYQVVELPMYQKDSKDKTEILIANLASADYLVFSSPRFWKNIPKDTKDYPVSAKFYSAIFDGSLGYRKVAEFDKFPSWLGIAVKDDAAEETFKVFEHPRVLIFKNFGRLSRKSMSFVLESTSR